MRWRSRWRYGITCLVARKARPKITSASPDTLGMGEQIRKVCQMVHDHLVPAHPNRQLQDDQVLGAMLAGFFDGTCRSLRLIDQLSAVPDVIDLLGCDRVARSTLSDALKRFDTSPLEYAVAMLRKQMPQLKLQDPVLEKLVEQIIAADGSSFAMAGE